MTVQLPPTPPDGTALMLANINILWSRLINTRQSFDDEKVKVVRWLVTLDTIIGIGIIVVLSGKVLLI